MKTQQKNFDAAERLTIARDRVMRVFGVVVGVRRRRRGQVGVVKQLRAL